METPSEGASLLSTPGRKRSCCCSKWLRFFIIIAIIILWSYYKSHSHSKDEWVFLMFTQQWSLTFCMSWKESGHESCHFAKNPLDWTIHGIWPTINNTFYPQYCSFIPFDNETIFLLKDQLEEHWPSISSNDELNFLRHEWSKHGTCSVELTALNSQLKYFTLGLVWNKQYNITSALNSCDIVPNDNMNYSSSAIYDCLTQYFGASPQIYCLEDENKKLDAIDEVRMCFDKNLNLKNCTDYHLSGILCNSSVLYPMTVPKE